MEVMMKNPFVVMAVMAAMMTEAFRENQLRNFYGKNFSGTPSKHRGHDGSKRPAHMIRSENRRRDRAQRLARREQRA
jgi:hypothetical protein